VYATVLSGFYLAIVLLLFALILRAVSLEFRSKEPGASWRAAWDRGFALGSVLAALLFGVALGNVLRGIPLSQAGDYTGSFLGLLNPYALLVGLLSVAMVAFHGALYLVLRTSGALEQSARRWASGAGFVYLGLFVLAGAITVGTQPHLLDNYRRLPMLWALPVIALGFVVCAVALHARRRPGWAFVCSSLGIAGLMGLVGSSLFPRLVPALGTPELSLTAASSSSSELTLGTMLVLTLIMLPIVAGYSIWVHRAFWGKVDPSHESSHY